MRGTKEDWVSGLEKSHFFSVVLQSPPKHPQKTSMLISTGYGVRPYGSNVGTGIEPWTVCLLDQKRHIMTAGYVMDILIQYVL